MREEAASGQHGVPEEGAGQPHRPSHDGKFCGLSSAEAEAGPDQESFQTKLQK